MVLKMCWKEADEVSVKNVVVALGDVMAGVDFETGGPKGKTSLKYGDHKRNHYTQNVLNW